MEHDKFKDLIQLAVAGEIDDEGRRSLDMHLAACAECRAEYDQLEQLMTLVEDTATYVTERDLWESRRRLREALKSEPIRMSTWARLRQPVNNGKSRAQGGGWVSWFTGARVAFSGAAAVALGLLIGYAVFGGGTSGTVPATQVAEPAAGPWNADHTLGPPTITNVRFVDVDPTQGEIELAYDLVRPAHLRADVEDARMKRMLTYAMVNEKNPGVRLKAIRTIDAYSKDTPDEDVKLALIDAAKSDPNDGVRKQALLALEALPFDEEVKQTYLFVLANDSNPGMRVTAINLLANARMEGHYMGPDVVETLKNQMNSEESNYIRARTGAFIQEVSDEH